MSETLIPIDDMTDDRGRRMQLRPCPFCGYDMESPITLTGHHDVRVSRLSPRLDGKPSEVIAVRISHWCPGTRVCVSISGRDHWDVEETWNRRAG